MVVDHRVLHRHRLQAGAARRAGVDDRPRHQHHRRPRRVDEVDRAGRCSPCASRSSSSYSLRGPLRHRDRRDLDAVDGRHHRRARRLRPDHRQRRRHRRDGRPAGLGARHHRPARRGRQHHQGGDQGLRDRLGRPRRAGAVRRLHARARAARHARQLRPVEPHGDRRPVHRRPDPLPVRRDGDGSGRPRGRRGGGRSAPPVPRDQGHHGRHGQAGVRRRGRHADQGGDQGDDHPVAAAGARADRRRPRCSDRRRSAAC